MSYASFLPHVLRRRLGSIDDGGPWRVDRPSVLLLADVVGFTAATARLTQSGPDGVERMPLFLSEVFGALTTTITAHGGDVVGFAGDAITALWTAEDVEGLDEVCIRALACALEIQGQVAGFAIGEEPLTFRQFAACGTATLVQVCSDDDRRRLFAVLGEVVDQMSAGAREAGAGEIWVAPDFAQIVGDRLTVGARGAAGVQALALAEAPAPATLEPADLRGDTVTSARRHVPPGVAAWVDAGESQWLGELRDGTVLFAKLPTWERGDDFLERLQALTGRLMGTVHRYEGAVITLSVDEKGPSLFAAFGLPPVAHEDDRLRALLCAMELRDQLREAGGTGSVGVASGPLYSGVVGNDLHKAYSLMGTPTNNAARLAQRAEGAVLCTGSCRQGTAGKLAFSSKGWLEAKGLGEGEEVFEPRRDGSGAEAIQGADPLGRGRVAVVSQLRGLLDWQVRTGSGQLALVVGDPGIGKSWLLRRVQEAAKELKFRILRGSSSSIERDSPLHVWRGVVSDLFELPRDGSASEVEAAILALLPEGMAERAPLFSALLPLSLPENSFTENLSPEGRSDQLLFLLRELLQTAAVERPTLIVLEDAHWFDSGSAAWLRGLVELVPELGWVVSSRPPTDEDSVVNALQGPPEATLVNLAPLERPAVDSHVCQLLKVAEIPEELSATLQARAEGNPFAAEQFALGLLEAGAIGVSGDTCQIADPKKIADASLPRTVRDMVRARVDRLSPEQQLLLKGASVMGRAFSLDAVAALTGRELATLERSADALLGNRLLSRPGSEGWMFGHAITRDTVYEQLLFAKRRELHGQAIAWLEAGEAVDQHYVALAYHAEGAGDAVRTVQYLEAAGEQALSRGAAPECMGHLLRAGEIAAREGFDAPDKRTWRYEILCEAAYRAGKMEDCITWGSLALDGMGLAMPTGSLWVTGSFFRLIAERNLAFLPRSYPPTEDAEERLRRNRAIAVQNRLSDAFGYTADVLSMLVSASRELALGISIDHPAAMARAHLMLYFVAVLTFPKKRAREWRNQAEVLIERETDKGVIAVVRARLSIAMLQDEIDYDRAARGLAQAMVCGMEVGNFRQLAEIHVGLFLHAALRGQWHEVLENTDKIKEFARVGDDQQFTTWGHLGEAVAALRMEDQERATASLAAAWPWIEAEGESEPGVQSWALGVRSQALYRDGEVDRAREMALQVQTTVKAQPLIAQYWYWWGIEGSCHTLQEIWRHADDSDKQAAKADADKGLAGLAPLAKSFAFARPIQALYQARAALIGGHPDKASGLLESAVDLAGVRQPEYAALAHAALADLHGPDTEAGRRHLELSAQARENRTGIAVSR